MLGAPNDEGLPLCTLPHVIPLGRWIEAKCYGITGPARDIYLQGGAEQDVPAYVTELLFPVARR